MTDLEISPSTVNEIDVCIPTWNSEQVLRTSLDHLAQSEDKSLVDISCLYIIDNNSEDGTVKIAQEAAEEYGWEISIFCEKTNLSEARKLAVSKASADWILFLDDDVRIEPAYLSNLAAAAAPLVGGVQGIKKTNTSKHNSNWVRWRSHRSGTHATLLRRKTVDGINIPKEITVLEDEYIRKYVEENGWLWVYNHQSIYRHDNMGRHPPSWEQGYLAGKYDLMSFCLVLRSSLATVKSGKYILEGLKQICGWLAGRIKRERDN
ncbi:glycosyltransferase family 2 protein [Haloarcula japonica]|uniref:glycosyltransferase family 2 protein n=1 Tax=Haloarcula japonica TaxID=29282 RepID=UPI0009B5A46D|nr:glycosyltransferase family 2 protein [Haloarcula japonica]